MRDSPSPSGGATSSSARPSPGVAVLIDIGLLEKRLVGASVVAVGSHFPQRHHPARLGTTCHIGRDGKNMSTAELPWARCQDRSRSAVHEPAVRGYAGAAIGVPEPGCGLGAS